VISKIRSLGLGGIRGFEVSVECFLSGGLPGFDIVGLPDAAVREARERVRAAVKSVQYKFPNSRITVNLAPADVKKAGTVYDLPIFLALLTAKGDIPAPTADSAFFGEISLTGELRHVNGALPMALAAERAGIKHLFVPKSCAAEASFAEDVNVYPVAHVSEIIAHFDGGARISRIQPMDLTSVSDSSLDFADVKGQENVRRALEVAAAGGHNLLLVGAPGAGKSMMAKRIPSILPEFTKAERIESTEIHSVAGLTTESMPILLQRPFRSPHHSASQAAMTGGTAAARPGEISLAHNGVLFLDELPEFHRDVLETLRAPLEDGEVTISRAAGSMSYPCRFMLVAAMNPCKCGWYGHPSGRCTCTEGSVKAYRERISGPLLDRIDMYVEAASLEWDDLTARSQSESSETIRARVNKARNRQRERYGDTNIENNARAGTREIEQFCALDDEGTELLKKAFDVLGLTGRSYARILRVARTIADLADSENIASSHLAEALRYRRAAFL